MALVIRSQKVNFKGDNMRYIFKDNALVILKKRTNTLGKELFGPIGRNFKLYKFRLGFNVLF